MYKIVQHNIHNIKFITSITVKRVQNVKYKLRKYAHTRFCFLHVDINIKNKRKYIEQTSHGKYPIETHIGTNHKKLRN